MGFLPSFLKKFIYRMQGYKIGSGVSIGPGSLILGKSVEIKDPVKIGFFTVVRGKNICIDRYVTIGSMTMIDSEKLKLAKMPGSMKM